MVTIIAVAGLVVLVPLLFYVEFVFCDLCGQPGPVPPSAQLSVGPWQGNVSVLTVVSVSRSSVAVSDLSFQIAATNGTMYYAGPAGVIGVSLGVYTIVVYNQVDGDGYVDVGDYLSIGVAPPTEVSQLRGATFKMFRGADVLDTVRLS